MKETIAKVLGISGLLALSASSALAANIALTNGGLGQIAAAPQQFGVAVCASTAIAQSIPIRITVNTDTISLPSAASIKANGCEYSYANYSQLNMESGKTYNVDVIIDPQHTVASNANNETVYTVTVPNQAGVAMTQPSPSLTANVATQFSNPLVALWNWLGDIYRSF